MSRHWITRGAAAALACCTVGLNPTVVYSQDGARRQIAAITTYETKKATTQTLGGPLRYLTFVSTDKPIYRAGEKVYVRGVLLNASNHKPMANGQTASPTVEIRGPKGDVVASATLTYEPSFWGCAWDVPQGQAGGEYAIKASYPYEGYAPAERKFDIRSYRAPRLKSQITFMRDGYGPGEKVCATLNVTRAEGGIPAGAKVTVTARVDGKEIKASGARVGANGLCQVSFELPRQIPRGEGTLALVIEDGGVVETASKTIPILLQTMDLQILPEGGDLLAGYSNRVYVQAKQPNGKPADLVAKLICTDPADKSNASGNTVVAEFRTEHEGRGRFEFTPVAGRNYFLTIVQPAGIKTHYLLPKCRRQGAVLRADRDVFSRGEPVTLHVGGTGKSYRVTLSKREIEVASCKVDTGKVPANQKNALHQVSFKLASEIDGVLTATVWDDKGVPLSERLLFREPANPLKISIRPDKKSYVPGGRTRLTVKTTDFHGKPVSAVVGLTVTDDSVLEMTEKREQSPRLPVMYYLEPEVKDLADAHVYLDPKNARAPLATDLLLGTQGWRRYASMDLAKFVESDGDEARRALALKMSNLGANLDPGSAWTSRANYFMRFPVAYEAYQMEQIESGIRGVGAVPGYMQRFPFSAAAYHADTIAPSNLGANVDPGSAWTSRANYFMRFPVAYEAYQMDQVASAKRAVAIVPPSLLALRRALVQQALRANARRIAPSGGVVATQSNLVFVREFAHQVRNGRKPTDRIDFAETLYFNSGIKTDARTGEATVGFGLNDSVSTFRVFADGFTGDGAIGAGSAGIASIKPFYAEPKLPLEVTAGDRILLPISLINATTGKLAAGGAKINLRGDFKVKEMLAGRAAIGAGERVRFIQPIDVGFGNGPKAFTLDARAGAYEDIVKRTLSVKPMGFPIETCFGGILEPGKPITHKIIIPKDVVPASMVSKTALYPTPLANLTEALERMIQDPSGCFEQTSSTSYPLTMAQQYFLSHNGIDPKLVEQAREKLDAGYKRLISFWCPDRGYEWFGENPGHEALTAFGLLHFSDMAKVRVVDQVMMAVTRAWLLKQRDGKGGFTRKRRALESWIEDKDDSNAYITWALMESGGKASELKLELASLKAAAEASQNSYVVALAANALYLAGDKVGALKLMDRLAAKQRSDGSVDSIKSSIVGSEGESLQVEGTSLATLAWLREPAYASRVVKSMKFLADSCKAGRYGSTQATVLALRAIVTYDQQRARPKAPGKVRVFVDGHSIGDGVSFNLSTSGAIKLPDLTETLSPGEHKLELRMTGGSPMPYSLAVKYNDATPPSDNHCKLDMFVKIAQDKLIEGAATEVNVTVTNKTNAAVPTPIAIVGLPGGLEPRHDQLKELVKKGKIDAYEVLGRNVVLYWRGFSAGAKVEIPLCVIAAVPGIYTGPASRAYLYYTDEHKIWVSGLKVEIAAK